MDWLNTLIGILIGIAIMIPAYFVRIPANSVRQRYQKFGIAFLAVACAIGGSELSRQYFYPYVLGWQFERRINEVPLFNMVAKHHPEQYAVFINQVKQGILHKEPEATLATYSTQLMERVFYQHLQTAPNEAVMRYLGAMLELYRYLHGQDPRAVLRMEYGQSAKGDFSEIWEQPNFKKLLAQLLEAKKHVIEASIASPQPIPSQSEAAPLLQAQLQEMSQKYGEQMVKEIFNRKQGALPANLIAPLVMDFYARMGTQGKEKAGIMMRYIASQKVKGMEAAEAKKKVK
jgi:hypothetical protein